MVSTVYGTHEWDGMAVRRKATAIRARSGLRILRQAPQTEAAVHIFHAPAVEFTTTDHELGATGLEWNVDSSVAMLKRIQPNFVTGGMIERLDVRPEWPIPLRWRMAGAAFGGGARDVLQPQPVPAVPGVAEMESWPR